MGQAVQLKKGPWGRGIDTQPCQHGFDADLNEWVRAFCADAELDAGTAPQLEASLVVGVEWKGGGGGGMSQARPFAKVGKPRKGNERTSWAHWPEVDVWSVARPADTRPLGRLITTHPRAARGSVGSDRAQELLLVLGGSTGREALRTRLSSTTSPGRHSGIPSELTVVAGPSEVGRAWTMPRLVSGA